MRRLPVLVALALCAAAALAAPAPAVAAVGWAPCPDAGFQAFECGRLTVPLDRSGADAGTVDLFARRLRAPVPASTAVVALAGGPGQAAAPLARSFAVALAPGLGDRDLLVFDQRGTGRSGALRCSALGRGGSNVAIAGACARELGSRRGLYRTADTVQDLEALRAEAGYERLTLYAVSYGTKVALEYAARYPDRVERLVLDSVVPPEGPDPLVRSSFVAARRILREQCAARRCDGVTPDPVGDVRRLMRRSRISGTYVDGRGRRRRASTDAGAIYRAYLTTDLNPAWRAQLAGATRAAVRGDATPLLRAIAQVVGGPGGSRVLSAPAGWQAAEDSNVALFLATACEEIRFPWDRGASVDQRVEQASAALLATPGSVYAPFERRTAAQTSVISQCLGWPHATPAPEDVGPLPPVPALLLNGRADIRTPLADAQAVAARIPSSPPVIDVPHVGHSVLGSDPSGCARAAIAQFFREGTATACPSTAPLVRPLPEPVRRLADLPVTARIRGRTGRTLTAAMRTRSDALAQALGAQLAGRTRAGGLRGGTVVLRGDDVVLRGFQYVGGVRVSGVFPADSSRARLRITGSGARGTLVFHRDGRVTGRLGGRTIRVRPRARAASLRTAGRDWTGFAAVAELDALRAGRP